MKKKASGEVCVVFVTIDKLSSARKLSRDLVSDRLAACVNILDINSSIYKWKGRICEDKEKLLIIKTIRRNLPALKERVASSHPYDIPEILAIDSCDVNKPYKQWLLDLIAD